MNLGVKRIKEAVTIGNNNKIIQSVINTNNTGTIIQSANGSLYVKKDDDWVPSDLGKITTDGSVNFSEDTYEKIFKEMAQRFNRTPILQHKCHNCGATVEMDANKHIFICKYCGTCYAIGTANVNDLGE